MEKSMDFEWEVRLRLQGLGRQRWRLVWVTGNMRNSESARSKVPALRRGDMAICHELLHRIYLGSSLGAVEIILSNAQNACGISNRAVVSPKIQFSRSPPSLAIYQGSIILGLNLRLSPTTLHRSTRSR